MNSPRAPYNNYLFVGLLSQILCIFCCGGIKTVIHKLKPMKIAEISKKPSKLTLFSPSTHLQIRVV